MADPQGLLKATDGALVLFSGGQDSATCLAWALDRFERVETIGFDYRQRHRTELDARSEFRAGLERDFPKWAAKLGEDRVLDLSVLGEISETALTRDVEIAATESGLPNTFVPGRNIIFLTFAAAVAYRRGLKHVVTGVCETDFSGYPDCRDDTVKALQVALNLGMESRFVLETPLMWIDKAQTWTLAEELGGTALVNLIRTSTLTCYHGEVGNIHEWGRGCGVCPACELRAKGYRQFAKRTATLPLTQELSNG
ncbi:MAG: 7-cyano-7-deazaguanine synthase QueC [Mesorhizobium sp.]|nr:MAG: 7-cyano-7-deazaguanine synthase QueC [Mesorhizobium sp.]